MVSISQSPTRERVSTTSGRAPAAPMFELPASITHAASAALTAAATQAAVKHAPAALVLVDVLVNPFVAGQCGAAGDLFGTPLFSQMLLDARDVMKTQYLQMK